MNLKTGIKKWIDNFTLVDFLFVGYMLLLSLLLIFFHRGVNKWGTYIVTHFIVIFLCVFTTFLDSTRTTGRDIRKIPSIKISNKNVFAFQSSNRKTHVLSFNLNIFNYKNLNILCFYEE